MYGGMLEIEALEKAAAPSQYQNRSIVSQRRDPVCRQKLICIKDILQSADRVS
jgi:hypothetical protein